MSMTKSCKAIIDDALSLPLYCDWLEDNCYKSYPFSIELLEKKGLLIKYVEKLISFKEGAYADACSDYRLKFYNQIKSLKSFLKKNKEVA